MDDTPGTDNGEGVYVGSETTDIIREWQSNQDIEPVPVGLQRLDTKGLAKTGHWHGCDSRFCREVHADPVFVLPDDEVT